MKERKETCVCCKYAARCSNGKEWHLWCSKSPGTYESKVEPDYWCEMWTSRRAPNEVDPG